MVLNDFKLVPNYYSINLANQTAVQTCLLVGFLSFLPYPVQQHFLEICHALEAEIDINRLGKLGIENPFFTESCIGICPKNSPESFSKVLNLFFFLKYVPDVNNWGINLYL